MNNCKLKRLFKKVLFFLIITIILWFLKLSFVSAAVLNSSFKVNNSLLLPNNYLVADIGNQNFYVNYDGYPDNLLNPSSPWFVSVVLCVDNASTSIYADNTAVTDINVNITNFKCLYPDSSYLGGKVTILNYKNAGGGSYNNTKFTWYMNDESSLALIDFKVSLDSWVVAQDYANITSIVNQQEFINGNKETNKKLDDLNKNLTDESSPNLNGLVNSAGWLKAGPVDSIINLPLTLLNNLQTNLGNTCNPVTVKLPYVNKDINLPCISAIYKQINGLDTWFQGIGVIAAAFILYRYFMYLYNRIDDTLSFRENNMQGYFDDSLWGGM